MLPSYIPPAYQNHNPPSSGGGGSNSSRLTIPQYIKNIREEIRGGNYTSALSISTRALDDINRATVVERTRLYLLRSEVYSLLGNGTQSLVFAEKALLSSESKSAHAYLILGREYFLGGKIQESVAAFEMAESILESNVTDLSQTRTDAEVLAEVGIDPTFLDLPSGQNSPTFRQTLAYRNGDVMAPESSDSEEEGNIEVMKEGDGNDTASGETVVTSEDTATTPKRKENSPRRQSVDITSAEKRRVFEAAVNMRSFQQFRNDALAMYTFLASRIISISVSHESLLRHALRRRPNNSKEVHVRIRNFSELTMIHAFERVDCVKFLSDLRLPQQIPHGHVAVGGMEPDSGLMWGQKAFVAIMGYTLGGKDPTAKSSTPSTSSSSGNSPPKSSSSPSKVEPSTVVLFRIEKTLTGHLKLGVRVEPISSMRDRGRMQEIFLNSATTTRNTAASSPNSGGEGSEGGVLFTPTCYCTFNKEHYMICATFPSKTTKAFSVVKVRKAISHIEKVNAVMGATQQAGKYHDAMSLSNHQPSSPLGGSSSGSMLGDFGDVDKRTVIATSNSLNDVDLVNVFEYLPATHRYKAACLSQHCRNIVNGLPPTSNYIGEYGSNASAGQNSVSNSSAWQWLHHSDGHDYPPKSTFPAYALRGDFFHNPWIVRDKETVELRLLLERNSLLLVNNDNHIVFEFQCPGTGSGTGRCYFGPHRCTQTLSLVESLVPLVETVSVSSAATGDERVAHLEFPREDMAVLRLMPIYHELSLSDRSSSSTSATNPVDRIPGRDVNLSLPLYTMRRRYVPGGKVLDQLQVTRTGTAAAVAHYRRHPSTTFRTQVGIISFEEGTDMLLTFSMIAYGHYKWVQRS